jgi:hypothetical protein
LEPVVARYRGKQSRRFLRGDAASTPPGIHEFLEAEGFGYGSDQHSGDRQLQAGCM